MSSEARVEEAASVYGAYGYTATLRADSERTSVTLNPKP